MNLGQYVSNLVYVRASQAKGSPSGLINSTTVTIAISLVALAISISLPLYLDSRQSPKVSVRISRLVFFGPDMNASDQYAISAINHGRSQVQINQVNISYIKKGRDHTEIFLPFTDFQRSPELPFTLAPYSDTVFYVFQSSVSSKLNDVEHYRLYGSFNLSSGYRVVSRKGLAPKEDPRLRPIAGGLRLPKRYPRLRRLRIIIFGKERSRWR